MTSRDKAQLQEYKEKLTNQSMAGAEANALSTEDAFVQYATELLMNREIYDDIDIGLMYRNTNKAMVIHGYSYNETEKVLSGLVVRFSDTNDLETMSQTEFEKLGKQCAKFISNIGIN